MPQCQCLTNCGTQCNKTASTKAGQNPLYCWQHQKCQKSTKDQLSKSRGPFYVVTISGSLHAISVYKTRNELIKGARVKLAENNDSDDTIRSYKEFFKQKTEDMNLNELIEIMIGLEYYGGIGWTYVIEGGKLFQ
jgi:hypothetical protein